MKTRFSWFPKWVPKASSEAAPRGTCAARRARAAGNLDENLSRLEWLPIDGIRDIVFLFRAARAKMVALYFGVRLILPSSPREMKIFRFSPHYDGSGR